MADYLFSKMPELFTNIENESWYRIKDILRRKLFDIKLNISVYRSNEFYIVIKAIKVNGYSHIVSSILMKSLGSDCQKNCYNEFKVYSNGKTLGETERQVLDKLLPLKIYSYTNTILNQQKRLIDFSDNIISYCIKNPIISVY